MGRQLIVLVELWTRIDEWSESAEKGVPNEQIYQTFCRDWAGVTSELPNKDDPGHLMQLQYVSVQCIVPHPRTTSVGISFNFTACNPHKFIYRNLIYFISDSLWATCTGSQTHAHMYSHVQTYSEWTQMHPQNSNVSIKLFYKFKANYIVPVWIHSAK